jgi:hypothetical protein
MTSEEFDFILIKQKEYIINLIDSRKFKEADACLKLVRELWETHSYGYKLLELRNRSFHLKAKPNDSSS